MRKCLFLLFAFCVTVSAAGQTRPVLEVHGELTPPGQPSIIPVWTNKLEFLLKTPIVVFQSDLKIVPGLILPGPYRPAVNAISFRCCHSDSTTTAVFNVFKARTQEFFPRTDSPFIHYQYSADFAHRIIDGQNVVELVYVMPSNIGGQTRVYLLDQAGDRVITELKGGEVLALQPKNIFEAPHFLVVFNTYSWEGIMPYHFQRVLTGLSDTIHGVSGVGFTRPEDLARSQAATFTAEEVPAAGTAEDSYLISEGVNPYGTTIDGLTSIVSPEGWSYNQPEVDPKETTWKFTFPRRVKIIRRINRVDGKFDLTPFQARGETNFSFVLAK